MLYLGMLPAPRIPPTNLDLTKVHFRSEPEHLLLYPEP